MSVPVNERSQGKFIKNCGVTIMLVDKKKFSLSLMADIENAVAGTEQNGLDVSDITDALVELGELLAEQDDAIVELAEIISE